MASLGEKLENALNSPAGGIMETVLEIGETQIHKVSGFIISNTFDR